jgi:hypothetical protein
VVSLSLSLGFTRIPRDGEATPVETMFAETDGVL